MTNYEGNKLDTTFMENGQEQCEELTAWTLMKQTRSQHWE